MPPKAPFLTSHRATKYMLAPSKWLGPTTQVLNKFRFKNQSITAILLEQSCFLKMYTSHFASSRASFITSSATHQQQGQGQPRSPLSAPATPCFFSHPVPQKASFVWAVRLMRAAVGFEAHRSAAVALAFSSTSPVEARPYVPVSVCCRHLQSAVPQGSCQFGQFG